MKTLRVIDFTSDCLLLANVPDNVSIVHCQTGAAVMHSGCSKKPPSFRYLRAAIEILRGRRYAWVILPPIHVDWTIANDPIRRKIKLFFAWCIKHPSFIRLLLRFFFGTKARFVVTDYSDMFHPSEFAIRCIQPDHYYMLNIPRSLVGTTMGPGKTLIHYLPTVIQDQLIDALQSRLPQQRPHDAFIAGTYHNALREKQLEASKILTQRGKLIFELKEKSFEKFSNGILHSRLCFAAKGLSYHCFRPLEAAAAGAAPIWHESENGAYHDYVHEENCFMYDPSLTPEEIADFVEKVLTLDDCVIVNVAEGAKKLLNQKHRASALSQNIWQTITSTPT